jgi:hypothetical protein
VGIAGRVIAILAGLVALVWYFTQGEINDLSGKVIMSFAIIGLLMAVISREPQEDERMTVIRMYAAIYMITTFLGSYAFIQIWIADGQDELMSFPEFSIFSLTLYLFVLEYSKRAK